MRCCREQGKNVGALRPGLCAPEPSPPGFTRRCLAPRPSHPAGTVQAKAQAQARLRELKAWGSTDPLVPAVPRPTDTSKRGGGGHRSHARGDWGSVWQLVLGRGGSSRPGPGF